MLTEVLFVVLGLDVYVVLALASTNKVLWCSVENSIGASAWQAARGHRGWGWSLLLWLNCFLRFLQSVS